MEPISLGVLDWAVEIPSLYKLSKNCAKMWNRSFDTVAAILQPAIVRAVEISAAYWHASILPSPNRVNSIQYNFRRFVCINFNKIIPCIALTHEEMWSLSKPELGIWWLRFQAAHPIPSYQVETTLAPTILNAETIYFTDNYYRVILKCLFCRYISQMEH